MKNTEKSDCICSSRGGFHILACVESFVSKGGKRDGKYSKELERQAFSLVIDNVLKSMRKDREAALLKIVDLAQKFMGNNFSPEAYEGARKMIKNPDAKWMRYLDRVINETDPHVAKMTALNLGYQAAFQGTKMIRKNREV